MKMANPPKVGILVLCTFRLLGSSKRFLVRATLKMVGIDEKTIIKEIAAAKNRIKLVMYKFIFVN